MKVLIIILFFILIILSMTINIDIEKLYVNNRKISFEIKLKIYILKYIKIFQKKIYKKEIIKLIKKRTNKEIKAKEKTIKKIKYTINDLEISIEYGIRNVLINSYLYGVINASIPMLKHKNNITNMKYKIKTNFKENNIKIEIKGKIKIRLFENIINIIESLMQRKKFNIKI